MSEGDSLRDLDDQVREILQTYMDQQSRSNLNATKERYWYPLSLATYGVDEVLEALDSMCKFRTTMWEKTQRFEDEFAKFQQCEKATMVNSGSSADLLLSFLLTDPTKPLVKPGSEILIPVVTWPTQIWSALMAGLKVKLIDVDPATLNVDLDDLEANIGPNTSAIFVVHLMGNPCDMERITHLANKHNLLIIEDCCEALGAKFDNKYVGNFGIGGAFSFFFAHHLNTMEGGMISCATPEIAERLRILRAHGWLRNVESTQRNVEGIDPRYTFVNWGFNVRPTEVQAGFGLHQLLKLPEFNARREILANRFYAYMAQCPHLDGPLVHAKSEPSWFALPLVVNASAPFSREDIIKHLEESGVETRPVVAGNLARHPAAQVFPAFAERKFPGADAIHQRGFYIGLSPMLTDSNMDDLIACFDKFLGPKG